MLNLGTETGNLVNHLMSRVANTPEPSIGLGATILHWTDRTAGTIVELLHNKRGELVGFVVQDDKATRTDSNGMSDAQSYRYAPNSQGGKTTVKRVTRGKKAGQWRVGGRSDGNGVLIGARDHHYDYSF